MLRALLPALLLLTACHGRPRDVVLITIDTLRADHLGAYGYARPTSPAIDALAAEGTVFEHAVPTCPATAPSIASLLTGLHRARHGVVRNGMQLPFAVQTFPAILQAHGFRTAARVANPILDEPHGFAQGFDDFALPPDLDRMSPAMFEGTPVVRAVDQLLAVPTDKPRFLWVHLMDPHGPYAPAARCREPFDPATYRQDGEASELAVAPDNYGVQLIPKYQAVDQERAPGVYRARYDGEIRCADDRVGEILDLLRRRGLWEHALIVVAADHGESLGEHGYYFQHGAVAYDDELRVPLVLHGPGIPRGRRIAATVSLIDVAPTILDLLGLPVPARMEGKSLRPLLHGDVADRRVFAQTYYGSQGLIALREGNTKYIFTPSPGDARVPPREELYDLAADPGELHDLAAESPERVRTLRQAVEDWLGTQGGGKTGGDAATAPRDPAVERQLRALGYLN